jgi:hypothetical protein
MMRLWVESYAKHESMAAKASVGFGSALTHAVVIALCIVGTLPPPNMPQDGTINRPVYVPPPDRVPGQAATVERISYVTLQAGTGFGGVKHGFGDAPTVIKDERVGTPMRDTVTQAFSPGPDSVYTVLDVDTAVVRMSSSAAPAYPLTMLAQRLGGVVSARYVVDTTGFADTTSFVVLNATNPAFVTSVREALPYMRFRPAKIGNLAVRQLVEQQFTFRIALDSTVLAKATKKP